MKSKKLMQLGRRKALQSQLSVLTSGTPATKPNQIELAFPDWIQAMNRNEDGSISPGQAKKDVGDLVGVSKAIGKGQANIAIALTQILNDCLTGECDTEGIPPIKDWSDILVILRAIAATNLGIELWSVAANIDGVLDIVDAESNQNVQK